MRENQEQPEEEGEEPEAATLSAADAMSLISQPGAGEERASGSEEDGSPPT